MKSSQLRISPEVSDALHAHNPVVALESTIISHGMPYPENVETALRVENIIREEGAVPATIAILKGIPVAVVGERNRRTWCYGRTGSESQPP